MVGPREPDGPGFQGVRRPRHGARSARRRHVPRHRPRHGALRRRTRDPGGAGHAPVRAWSCRAPSPTACAPRGWTSPTSGSPPPTSSTSPAGHLDAPGAMFTASHNPAQYNGMKLCFSGRAPDRPRHRAGRHRRRGREAPRRTRPGPHRGTPRAGPARRMGRPRHLVRRRRVAPTAQGRGRHRQRHGRARGAHRLRPAALRRGDPLPRARRLVPQPPGRPDPAREPGRPEEGGARSGRRHRPRLRR